MKKERIQLLLGFIIFLLSLIYPFQNELISPALYIISYVIVGREVVLKAFKNILKGKVFDENFLMMIATIGAFLIGEYPEAVAVMLFYQVGELFQDYAVNKSRKSIVSLMDIRPDYANLKQGDLITKVDPYQVEIGQFILVRPGERIPLDGIIRDGFSSIDTSSLTGESLPREVSVGSEILSGCVNINGLLTIEVTKKFSESTVNKILDLVENASEKKSKSENFITKFAQYYTPVVVLSALAIAFLPPLFLPNESLYDWIYRALTFLVVSCPCALVISIPLGFFGGIGGASKLGILVKGSNYLEALAQTEVVVFDKTGTLTKGIFEVQQINPIGMTSEELLKYACSAESHSNHPISLSLKKAYHEPLEESSITNVEEVPGYGVLATVDGVEVLAGNTKWMEKQNIEYPTMEVLGTVVHVAVNGTYAGNIFISDVIKEDAKEAIYQLKKHHVKKIVMLTGDSKKVAESVSNELKLDQVYAELLPADKVEKVEQLIQKKSTKGKLAFVGDGVNDAPVLALADIGIAMGGLGSDAAIEAADIVLMTDEPSKIAVAIELSKKTLSIVKQNIFFSLFVKLFVLGLSAFGFATMWEAVFADVGVSILAILNSFRALASKK